MSSDEVLQTKNVEAWISPKTGQVAIVVADDRGYDEMSWAEVSILIQWLESQLQNHQQQQSQDTDHPSPP